MGFYTNSIDAPENKAGLAALGQALSRMLTPLLDAQDRSREVGRLEAMSDAELAKLGVNRTEIVRYVYRDILHV